MSYNTYLIARINELTAFKTLLEEFLQKSKEISSAEELLAPDSPYRELILPRLNSLSRELEEWKAASYDQFDQYEEGKINRSSSGDSYRSKSEAYIASVLDHHHLAYHYEEVRDVNGRLIAVDFTIRHPKTGKIILWEHFGLLDDNGYLNNSLQKIYDYIQAGWIPMNNLILTFETKDHPLDFQLVNKLVEYFFLD